MLKKYKGSVFELKKILSVINVEYVYEFEVNVFYIKLDLKYI